MECIFDGLITVTAASNQTTTPDPNMPQGPFTAAQIEAAIAVVTGKAPEPKKERTNDELIVLIRAAALPGWERGRPDDEHSPLLRAALANLNGPPPQTIFKKIPSTWRQIGSAHVGTPVPNAQLVCRHLL